MTTTRKLLLLGGVFAVVGLVLTRVLGSSGGVDTSALAASLGLETPEQRAAAAARAQLEAKQRAAAEAKTQEEFFPDPLEQQVIDRLRAAGQARIENRGGLSGTGVFATPDTMPADRKLLAETSCRRAVDQFGLPVDRLQECITVVSRDPAQVSPQDRTLSFPSANNRSIITVML